jgi:tetratricopeptide (TPR) repeat protein
LLAPEREKSDAEIAYRGEVVSYYPAAARPEDAAYLALAQVAQDANREEGVRKLEQLALRPEFQYELASAYQRAGDLDKAAAGFRQVLEAAPAMTVARRRLGEALRLAGRLQEARQELETAAGAKQDPRIRKELGLVYAAMERPEQAAAEFRAAIALDPTLPENHNNLGGALLQLGREEQAEAAYREAIRLQPDLAEANFGLGNLLAARGQVELAQQHWRIAIAGEPRSAPLRYNYAVTLIQRDRWREAREQLEAAVEADPEMDAARLALGELLLAEGRVAQARGHLDKAAASADPAIRKAALEALTSIAP